MIWHKFKKYAPARSDVRVARIGRIPRPLLATTAAVVLATLLGNGHRAEAGPTKADLEATVRQSAVDKLLDSVAYPFTLIERSTPFPRTKARGCRDGVTAPPQTAIPLLLDRTRNKAGADVLGSMHRNIRSALAAHDALEAGECRGRWSGPGRNALLRDLRSVEAILHHGAAPEGVAAYRRLRIEFRAVVRWFKVDLDSRPTIALNGPRLDVQKSEWSIGGRAEVWVNHPWLKCTKRCPRPFHKLCCRWKWTNKWTRLLAVCLKDVEFGLEAAIKVRTLGARVLARAHLSRFRLKSKYLKWIPLEKPANKILERKEMVVFDASSFVATVPVLGTRFGVDRIAIPARASELVVQVWVRQKP